MLVLVRIGIETGGFCKLIATYFFLLKEKNGVITKMIKSINRKTRLGLDMGTTICGKPGVGLDMGNMFKKPSPFL